MPKLTVAYGDLFTLPDGSKIELSPAMRDLPNDKWRLYVHYRYLLAGKKGAISESMRRAGFGSSDTQGRQLSSMGCRLEHDPRMIVALREYGEIFLRRAAPDMLAVVREIAMNARAKHSDRLKASAMFIDRAHPLQSVVKHDHTHKIVDHDKEAITQLRKMIADGATLETLQFLYGEAGLARYLARIEAEDGKRPIIHGGQMKVIEATAVEVLEPSSDDVPLKEDGSIDW